MLFELTREEKAFVMACIQIKADAEKEYEKKMNVKTPHKRRQKIKVGDIFG